MVNQTTPDAGRRSVAANAASLFIGRLVSALSIWAALIVLAKLSGPEIVGVYALAQALCIPIAEVAKLGLKEARSSDVAGDYSTGQYWRLRSLMCFVAMAAMIGLGATQSDTNTVLLVIGIYGLTRVVEMITDIIHAQFLLVERLDYVGWSLCMSGPLALIALALGYYLTESLVIAVVGQLIAMLVILVVYDLPIYARIKKETGQIATSGGMAKIAQLARLTLPLGFATALIMLGLYLPRIWVNAELGVAALGVFGPILALCMAPDRLVNSMLLAMSVRLATHYSEGRLNMVYLRLTQIAVALVVLGAPVILICYYYGDVVLTAIYSAEFAEHSDLLVMLAIAGLLRIIANSLGFGLIASRQFWWLTVQNAAVATASVLGCLFLISPFGLVGAGWCMLLIFAVQLVCVLIALLCIPKPGREA